MRRFEFSECVRRTRSRASETFPILDHLIDARKDQRDSRFGKVEVIGEVFDMHMLSRNPFSTQVSNVAREDRHGILRSRELQNPPELINGNIHSTISNPPDLDTQKVSKIPIWVIGCPSSNGATVTPQGVCQFFQVDYRTGNFHFTKTTGMANRQVRFNHGISPILTVLESLGVGGSASSPFRTVFPLICVSKFKCGPYSCTCGELGFISNRAIRVTFLPSESVNVLTY